MSIFTDIGGRAAVDAAVSDFYERVLADPSLLPYFDGVNIDRLKGHQRAFIAAALGGPAAYTGRDMKNTDRSTGKPIAATPSAPTTPRLRVGGVVQARSCGTAQPG